MADASFAQTGFLGGEFSPYAQGVLDDPDYKKGMNVCRNVIPMETGAATRRTGTKELAFTRKGSEARILDFQFTGSVPYTMEFTDGFVRFYNNQQLIGVGEPRSVLYINTATPAVMVTSETCDETWADGDTVYFHSLKPDWTSTSALYGRQFLLRAGVDDQHWTLFDALTGQPLNGETLAWTQDHALQVIKVFELQTPYLDGAWQNLRATQSDDMIFLWHRGKPPQVIFAPIDGGSLFTINQAQFIDGPYLDPPTDGSYLTPDAVSGLITLTLNYPAWSSTVTYKKGTRFVNNTQTRAAGNTTAVQYTNGAVVKSGGSLYVSIADGNLNHSPPNASWWKPISSTQVFASTDLGRAVRLFAEPAAWVVGTTYAANDLVKYQDAYYTALQASTGKVPGADAENWGVAANAAAWTWGIITTYTSPTSVQIALQGDALLYNQDVLTWRLGVFSDTTGYPACGAFHEGRLWTGGCVKNRFDVSGATGDIFDFSPTSPDGTVSDANGISRVLKSKTRNQIVWMNPALGGILMGTSQAEWLVQASANNDPITPTNIQAHDHTALGSANVEATRCGSTIAFVQRYGNMVMEYLADLFSGKPAGKNLAVRAKHLTDPGIIRVAYQQELVPVLWAVTADGDLIGTTYKRESLMVSQPPTFNAWHRHDLGSGFSVLDVTTGGAAGGLYDTATIVTKDPATGYCRVEAITEVFKETGTIDDAWFVDCGVQPSGGTPMTINAVDGITFGGLGHFEGKTVDAFIAGLDLGRYTVSGGTIFVPYQSDPDRLFTLAYLVSKDGDWNFWTEVVVPSTSTLETMLQFPPISSDVLNRFTYLDYGEQAVADWANDRVTFLLPGTTPECGFIQYRISTGALIQYVTISTVFGATDPPFYDDAVAYTATPKVVGSNNFIYTAQVSNSRGVDPTSSGQTDWLKNDIGLGNPTTLPNVYSGATTYAAGDYATSAGFIWKSLQNSNTGNTPASNPTWWQQWYATPSAWDADTTYGAFTPVTTGATNGHIFWPLGDVPAGMGDPNTFSTDNNPYWQTTGSVWGVGIITTSGLGLDHNGDIWMYQSGTSFNSTFVKIDGATLTLKGVATKAAGLVVPTPSNYSVHVRIENNNGLPAADLCIETVDTTPAGDTEAAVVVLDGTGMFVGSTSSFSLDAGFSPVACAGPTSVGYGQAYILSRNASGPASSDSVGFYELDISLPQTTLTRTKQRQYLGSLNKEIKLATSPNTYALSKIAALAPGDISPDWTLFSGISGLIFDPNDGNVMFFVSTLNPSNWSSLTTYGNGTTINDHVVGSDGKVYHSIAAANLNHDPTSDAGVHWTLVNDTVAAETQYLVKLATDCGRQVWRIAVTAGASTAIISDFCVDVSSGYYVWLEDLGLGSYQVRQVDTLTGQSTIIFPTQKGLAKLGAVQLYNSQTGDVIIYPQYDSTASGTSPPPTPVGATPSNFTGWGRWNVTPPIVKYRVSGVVGFSYTSQGQLLRPVSPAESGARNGPAFGKTRRNHRYALACANTQGITIGSDFSKPMRPAQFKSDGGKGASTLPMATLYTGEHSDTVEGDYNLDGMLAWQITRPYPATVTAFGGFLQTQDR